MFDFDSKHKKTNSIQEQANDVFAPKDIFADHQAYKKPLNIKEQVELLFGKKLKSSGKIKN